MIGFQRYAIGAMMVCVAAGAYWMGQREEPPVKPTASIEPRGVIVPESLTALRPANSKLAISDPTGVLLGEVGVSDEMLGAVQRPGR
jgi:hypothetical protein